MRIHRRWIGRAVATLLAAGLLAGCGSSAGTPAPSTTPPPTPTDLISRSAAAMQAVTSAHFVISVTGTLPDLEVQSAEGDLSNAGSAQGKATIKQLGQLIEVEFVVVDKDLYLKGATGGFTKLPAALANEVYDPTAILNRDKGVARVLTNATGLSAVTESGSAYTVTGNVPRDVAASLTPGISTDVVGTFIIESTTSQLTSVAFALTGSDGQPAGVQLALSDFNKTLSITAPSGQ